MIIDELLVDVNLLLTSTCNQRCPFCFAIDHIDKVSREKTISDADFNRVLELLKKDRLGHVNLIGGEPSLHPLAGEFIGRLLKEDIRVGFSTNALWTDAFREAIAKFKGKIGYEVTLHNKEFYSDRNLSRLEKTLASLEGEDVSLGLTIVNERFDYSHHLSLAKSYGFDIRWSLAEPTTRTSNSSMEYRSVEDLRRYGDAIFNFVKVCETEGISTWNDLEIPKCAFSEEQTQYFRTSEEHDVNFRCPPFIDIGPDLKVWKCFPLSSIEMRHIDDFTGIRAAYQHFKDRFNYLEMVGSLDECKKCKDLAGECAGGSKIMKYLRGQESERTA